MINKYLEPNAICKKCHEMDEIYCKYCFCPLYFTDCKGNHIILSNGIKDCSHCIIPHTKEFIETYKD